jgi:hypothetical protein
MDTGYCSSQIVAIASCDHTVGPDGSSLLIVRRIPAARHDGCERLKREALQRKNETIPAFFGVRGRGPTTGEIRIPFRLEVGQAAAWSRMDDPMTFLGDGPTGSGSSLAGADTGELVISSFTEADEDEYIYWTTFDGGQLEPIASVFVYVDRIVPHVTDSPMPREGCLGGTESFRIESTGASGYRWYWNSRILEDGVLPTEFGPDVFVAGADTNELTLIGLTEAAEGELSCTVFGTGDEESRDVSIFPFDLTVSDNTAPPTIITQPQAVNQVRVGQDVEIALEAVPATPGSFVSYRWYKDGTPIFGDGRVSGTNFPDLLIRDVTLTDEGVYECVVTQACGSVTSAPALLAVTCPADTNGDGQVSPSDFSAWVQAYNSQSAECDQNNDGDCSPADFSAWVQNFNAGC